MKGVNVSVTACLCHPCDEQATCPGCTQPCPIGAGIGSSPEILSGDREQKMDGQSFLIVKFISFFGISNKLVIKKND